VEWREDEVVADFGASDECSVIAWRDLLVLVRDSSSLAER